MLSKKLLHCDVMQRARVKSKLYLPGNSNNNVALPLAPVEERSPADEQIPSAGMPRGLLLPKRSQVFANHLQRARIYRRTTRCCDTGVQPRNTLALPQRK